MEACKTQVPAFRDIGNEHQVACHLYDPAHQGGAGELTAKIPQAGA
jgi:hypothetical protein